MADNQNLEEMFKDRYTEKDERYKKIAEGGFEKVVVVHPWNSRDFNRGGGRGGFRGNFRGGWNNPRGRGRGGGGGWHGGQQWRGGDRQQRRHD